MFRKLAIAILSLLVVSSAAALVGCGGSVDYDEKYSDRTKIIFELEGGKYKNSTTSVNHYYKFGENAPHTINPLETDDNPVTKDGGFTFEGWFRGEKDESGKTVYGDKWNFTSDTVSAEGVTLYAKWKSPIIYTFDFVSVDESGNESVINSLEVKEGDNLAAVHTQDVLVYANKLTGHTAINVYYDKAHTQPFDDSIKHPGGEVSFGVKLYVEFIDGEYTIVRTASDLTKAKTKNIYVMPNSVIDMQGAELSFTNYSNKTFLGNGATIKNFTIRKDWRALRDELEPDIENDEENALYFAIFRNVKNTVVRDVTFEDVTLTVDMSKLSGLSKIYVAPLAVSAADSVFENVSVKATFGYTEKTEKAYDVASVLVFVQSGVYVSSNSTVPPDGNFEITLAGKIEN